MKDITEEGTKKELKIALLIAEDELDSLEQFIETAFLRLSHIEKYDRDNTHITKGLPHNMASVILYMKLKKKRHLTLVQ